MNWVGIKIDQGPVKSPSIPLYKRGKILKWFQQVPPFHKGGLGGIFYYKQFEVKEILP